MRPWAFRALGLLAATLPSAVAAPLCMTGPTELNLTAAPKVATVAATAGRLPLHRNLDPATFEPTGCQPAACPARGYLVPGDPVLVSSTSGAWSCIAFTSTAGTFSQGWVETARLRPSPSGAARPADWVGSWVLGPQSITLRVRGSQLVATGEALWPWQPRPGQKPEDYSPNTGELDATGPLQGGRAVLRSAGPGCTTSLVLAGPYLLVRDSVLDGQCDDYGHNVTFSGLYRRGK